MQRDSMRPFTKLLIETPMRITASYKRREQLARRGCALGRTI